MGREWREENAGTEPLDLSRTLILGNSGSGKSWLSQRLAAATGSRATDLDSIHWEPGGYGVAREREFARAMVRNAAAAPQWVIEGVFGWLAEEALSHATALLWLDMPVDDCLSNIDRRGLRRGGDEASFAALIAWATAYPQRRTSSSFSGHDRLYSAFHGHKARLSSRREVDLILASARQRWGGVS